MVRIGFISQYQLVWNMVLNDMGITTQHQLNFNGGSDNIRYFVGMGYVYDEKLTPGVHDDRFNLSGNISADIKPWLTLNTNVKYIYKQYKRNTGSVALMTCLTIPVTYVAKQSTGEWGSMLGGEQAPAEYTRKPHCVIWKTEDGRNNTGKIH